MQLFVKNLLLVLLGSIILGALYGIYYSTHQVGIEKGKQLAALLPSIEEPLHLDPVVKSEGCTIRGPLPDHDCTPGSVFADATKEKICVDGYTKTVRNVSVSLKKKVYAKYGIPYPPAFGTYETDHLIPLALGGDNDVANLFPEAAEPAPGFKEKDVVENYLRQEVCSGRIALSVAQEQIANDWLLIYNSLNPEVIREFKARFRSWAD